VLEPSGPQTVHIQSPVRIERDIMYVIQVHEKAQFFVRPKLPGKKPHVVLEHVEPPSLPLVHA